MNPARRPLIAGNWKMNAGGRDACALAFAVAQGTRAADRVDVVVAPPFTAIAAVAHEIEEARGSIDVSEGFGVGVAAQNMHAQSSGAFTGEISAPMLRDAGATWVILGHSERRQLFGETDAGVEAKVKAALEAELRPIICVGETLAEREAERTLEVVEGQVRAFMQLLAHSPGFGVIAYEPVWAIGTGRVAKPEDAQAVHAAIRALLRTVSEHVAESTRILYGGSVKADNAAGLLGQADIDGALVGGASLDGAGFSAIAAAAQVIAVASTPTEVDDATAEAPPVSVEAPITGASAADSETDQEPPPDEPAAND
ncbi:MAG: triose-phosphate isomerase [Polyangiaceae bacterium]